MSWQWLSQLLQMFADLIPRHLIVRTDENTIEFVLGLWPRKLEAGWYIQWPLLARYETVPIMRQTADGSQRFDKYAFKWILVYEVSDSLSLVTRTYDFDRTIIDFAEIALGKAHAESPEADLLTKQDAITKHMSNQLDYYGVKLIEYAIVSAAKADRQFSIWELNPGSAFPNG